MASLLKLLHYEGFHIAVRCRAILHWRFCVFIVFMHVSSFFPHLLETLWGLQIYLCYRSRNHHNLVQIKIKRCLSSTAHYIWWNCRLNPEKRNWSIDTKCTVHCHRYFTNQSFQTGYLRVPPSAVFIERNNIKQRVFALTQQHGSLTCHKQHVPQHIHYSNSCGMLLIFNFAL